MKSIFLYAYLSFLSSKKLYPLYSRLSKSSSGYFCNDKTDLCIEGFESSANTFLFNALHCLRPDLNYARHKHVVANLKLASDYSIPTVILFRDPVDCIPSLASRFRPDIHESLYRYVWFYKYVINKMYPEILLLSFEEVTNEIESAIRRISDFAGFSFEESGLENIEEKAKERIQKRTQKRAGTTNRISLPNKERENKKKELREKLQRYPKLYEAKKLYNCLKNISTEQKNTP